MKRRPWEAIGAIAAVAGVILAVVAILQNGSRPAAGPAENAARVRETTFAAPPYDPRRTTATVQSPLAPSSPPVFSPSKVNPPATQAPLTHGGPLTVTLKLTGGAVGVNKVNANNTATIGIEVSDQAGYFKLNGDDCFQHIEVFLNGSFKGQHDYVCANYSDIFYPRGTWRIDYTITTTFGQTAKASITLESV